MNNTTIFNSEFLKKLIKERLSQEEFDSLYQELQDDRENELPNRPYKGNCTKEFCDKIIDKFIDIEYERIKTIDFPPVREFPIELSMCETEFLNLLHKEQSIKTSSPIVQYFHTSIVKANVCNNPSPYDGWKETISNKESFRHFYANRLRCSDWFNERGQKNIGYLLVGYVPDFIYGIGLSTSRMFQMVTYFKPALAKYLVVKYLNDYDTVFDPFSGYSGRMIGALAANKNYIGQDLCVTSVDESKQIYDFVKQYLDGNLFGDAPTCSLSVADVTKTSGKYDCLLTCSPYENIENWPGVESVGYGCDQWIDICLHNFDCNKYVFVTDGKIIKYKPYIKEQIVNTSHFAENVEFVVVITKAERDEIINGNVKDEISDSSIESAPLKPFVLSFNTRSKAFQNLGIDLFNLFNAKHFNHKITIPKHFDNFVNMIYKKFEMPLPEITYLPFKQAKLKTNDDVVVLCFSGGLDSCSQALLLRKKGYIVHLFHVSNANRYENGQGTKVAKEFAEKFNMPFIEAHLSNGEKEWPENPMKNQMIIASIVDYCIDNGYNKIGLGEKEVLTIDEVVSGINVTDSKDINDTFIKALKHYVENLKIIDVDGCPSKLTKLKILEKNDALDYYYSCLQAGRFNQMRHNEVEKKYNIKLPLHNCGCYCRKCATQILMWKYYGTKKQKNMFPDEFIDKCWKIMYDNGFSSEKRFFTPDIPLEQRIKNLLEQ